MSDLPQAKFRDLPPVHEILLEPEIVRLVAERGHDSVRRWVREALADVRQRLLAGIENGSATREQLAELVLSAVHRQAGDESSRRLGGVINATGVILHTGLGRAPLCAAAVDAIRDAAGACNLEVDLETTERRYRGYQLQSAWKELTGSEAALVVNNNAAATVLALDALARGREVIISRGQLIEIGGSFRLPEIFAQSGAILREVGTTNRTTLADYERAIGPNTAAILRVHPSNYRVVGFTDAPSTNELVQLAHQYGLVCIDDIGSGCLVDTTRFGLPAEPTFPQSLAEGADLVLGSGDKLLGGPQCGILLGHAELVEKLGAHPLARAVRIDKLTLAALSATLGAYQRGAAEQEIPTLALLAAPQDSLLSRARAIVAALHPPPLSKGGAGGSDEPHARP
ncbi:MAG: L-seryl-tRNA(Sec) selenium transferase [Planctomycetia bacterium]|nr:L-seryl-tRNA(Sec) selenium transferase [Planctomycetia bacterium]